MSLSPGRSGAGVPRKRGRGRSKTSVYSLTMRDKHLEWLRLRKTGMSWRAIATVAGTKAHGGIRVAVEHLLKELARDDLLAVMALENARLDHYLERLAPGIAARDVEAIGMALKVAQRRAALLGLDAPKQAPVDRWGNTITPPQITVNLIYESHVEHPIAEATPGTATSYQ